MLPRDTTAVEALARRTTPDPRRWWELALLCGAFFMVILDAAIVIVAMPSIHADLGFSEQGLQWVLTEGFQSAFLACVVLAAIGVAGAPLARPAEPGPRTTGARARRRGRLRNVTGKEC
jgi:MFS family permease